MDHLDSPFNPEQRKRLAKALDMSEQYLWQLLTGRRDMSPAEAMRIEIQTRGELKRWHLCRRSWHLIWPDLLEHPDAPETTPKVSPPDDETPKSPPMSKLAGQGV